MTSARYTITLSLCTLLIAGITGCGGGTTPLPTNQEMVTRLQKQAESRRDAMLAKPVQANQEISLFLESVEASSSQYGEPFTSYLATVKQMQTELGDKPKPDTVKNVANRLVEEAAKMGA